MRTLSCKGCEYCNYDNEELKEYIDNDCEPIINEMVDQALYKLTYVNIKHDYETGYVDNYDIEFEIIK